jgi:hypothetical protein
MLGMTLEKMPVSNSGETQLVVAALLNKKIDAFFALPDNIIFASMEVVVKSCDDMPCARVYFRRRSRETRSSRRFRGGYVCMGVPVRTPGGALPVRR